MGAEPNWKDFKPGEAPFLLKKEAASLRSSVRLVQGGTARTFLLAQGHLVGFASNHPAEQPGEPSTAEEVAANAAKAVAKLVEAGGQLFRDSSEPSPCPPLLLDLVLLEAFRRTGEVQPVLGLLGAERPFNRVEAAPPASLRLSPLEAYLWETLSQPKSVAQVQALMPQEAQALARAFAALACLGLIRPAGRPAQQEEKPRFPPANPALCARLAQIAREGGLPSVSNERVLSQEELERAQKDKEKALQLLAQGEERQAVRLLMHAVSMLPDPHSLVLLAELEVANPLWRERALAHLKQALEMDPRFTPAWLALANYWGLRGDTGKQRRCLENILKYDPHNREAKEALAHLMG